MTFTPTTDSKRTVRIGGVTRGSLLERLAAAQVQINSPGLQLFSDERFCPSVRPRLVVVQRVSVVGPGLELVGRSCVAA